MSRLWKLPVLLACLAVATLTPIEASAQATDQVMDTQPQNSWGVTGLDRGSGNFQYYSPVFGLAEVGDRVFAGGKFLEATNGSTTRPQPYLAAFDQATGDFIPSFDPVITRSVFDLEADPARNRLFVGGEFPSANGATTARGFVALNATTGATDPNFNVRVGTWTGNQPRVHALEVSGGYLYLAGYFGWVTGNDGRRVPAQRVARVSLATGQVDANWTPKVSGGAVWEIKADPTHRRVLLGGLFRQVNGANTAAFAMVNDTNGALTSYDRGFGLRYFDSRSNNYDFVSSIAVGADQLVLGGQKHRTVVTDTALRPLAVFETNAFSAANGGRGGDTQTITIDGNIAYVGCHCWGQVRPQTPALDYLAAGTDVRSVYAIDLTTHELVKNYQPDFSGRSGPWASLIDDDGCLWLGTDAHQAGQRAAYGIVKTCPRVDLAQAPGVTATFYPGPRLESQNGTKAIDGDFATNPPVARLARSALSRNPALYVDLGSVQPIDDVVLWARTDGGQYALTNVTIWASERSLDRAAATLDADPEVTSITKPGSHAGKRTLSFSFDRRARYLRIELDLPEEGRLDLAEVAVFEGTVAVNATFPLRTTLQTRERVVLNWNTPGPVTIRRNGTVVGTDDDGWFTDLRLSAGTSYRYSVTDSRGAVAELTTQTRP